MRKDGQRLAALDGLRGLAILLVLIYHYTVRWAAPHDPANHLPAASIFSGLPVVDQFGWAGVSLFFMISGFVIHMTLERSGSVIDFAIRRLARLWPPLIVGCTLTALFLLLFGPSEWKPTWFEYGFSILFIDPAMVGEAIGREGIYSWVDGVYWTLFVEVRFYLLAAFLWLLWPRKFLPVIVGFSAAGLAVYVLAGAVSPLLAQIVDLFTFAKEAPYFAIGVLAHAWWRGNRSNGLLFGLMACVALSFVVAGPSFVRIALNALTLGLVAAAVIPNVPGVAVISRGILPAVGRISYSLYLLHQMIGVSALILLTGAGVHIGWAIAGVTLAVMGAAWLHHHWVEAPGARWVTARLTPVADTLVARWPRLAYLAA